MWHMTLWLLCDLWPHSFLHYQCSYNGPLLPSLIKTDRRLHKCGACSKFQSKCHLQAYRQTNIYTEIVIIQSLINKFKGGGMSPVGLGVLFLGRLPGVLQLTVRGDDKLLDAVVIVPVSLVRRDKLIHLSPSSLEEADTNQSRLLYSYVGALCCPTLAKGNKWHTI